MPAPAGIQSPCLTSPGGRSFACDKSDKGKGTKTAMPAAGVTTLRPPQAGSSPQRGPPHSRRLCRVGWRQVLL
jgi:hypothetical protein